MFAGKRPRDLFPSVSVPSGSASASSVSPLAQPEAVVSLFDAPSKNGGYQPRGNHRRVEVAGKVRVAPAL